MALPQDAGPNDVMRPVPTPTSTPIVPPPDCLIVSCLYELECLTSVVHLESLSIHSFGASRNCGVQRAEISASLALHKRYDGQAHVEEAS